MYPRQVQHRSDLAHAVIAWDDLIETEHIEQLPLVSIEPPHHRQSPPPRRLPRGESRFAPHNNRLLQQNRLNSRRCLEVRHGLLLTQSQTFRIGASLALCER